MSSTFGVWTSTVTTVAKLELKTPTTSTERFESGHPQCCKLAVWTETEAEKEGEGLT